VQRLTQYSDCGIIHQNVASAMLRLDRGSEGSDVFYAQQVKRMEFSLASRRLDFAFNLN
jgi:hypothetical protein